MAPRWGRLVPDSVDSINSDVVNGTVMLTHGAALLEKLVKALPGQFSVQTVFISMDSFLGDVRRPSSSSCTAAALR